MFEQWIIVIFFQLFFSVFFSTEINIFNRKYVFNYLMSFPAVYIISQLNFFAQNMLFNRINAPCNLRCSFFLLFYVERVKF